MTSVVEGGQSPGTKRGVVAEESIAKMRKVSEGNEEVLSGTPVKNVVGMSQLDSLKKLTVVVADTGDFEQIRQFNPEDATTNPTLLLQACSLPQYRELFRNTVQRVVEDSKNRSEPAERQTLIADVCDELAVEFGCELLKIVPGVVSTEVNARLSFDTQESINKARRIIGMYDKNSIDRKRILIKMATTWESCEAAKVLQTEGINTNMTLVFSLPQAIAAAEANATLISPFVGRILDWHVKATPEKKSEFVGKNDPGVQSVTEIFNYYKIHKYKTIIMGASFRNKEEILALAGCDKLTISPSLLASLQNANEPCEPMLDPEAPAGSPKLEMDEKLFRWMLNENQMATEKLSEGIRNFNIDLTKLEKFVTEEIDKTTSNGTTGMHG